MHVAIRVDASQGLGTGHLRRCLSLARALVECNCQTVFMVRDTDGIAKCIMQGQPFAVHWLKPNAEVADHTHDALECISILAAAPPAWVLVDHYQLGGVWHDTIRSQLQCRIAVVDDLADRQLAPDLLVDHNDAAAHSTYAPLLARRCSFLAGPDFALLDPVYASAPRYRFSTDVRSIGIFMGGTDPHGHCLAALLACRELLGFSGPVEIVCAPSSPTYAVLEEECRRWPGTSLQANLPDLAAFFARHDLQIGAGGGAVWERCCIGVPTIACVTAPNQLSTVPRLAALGALAWAREDGGDVQTAIAVQVKQLLGDAVLRRSLGERAAQLVDGRGSARVAAVLACLAGVPLQVREAGLADEALLLEWANDPVVRANAFQPEPVLPQNHAVWLRARLAERSGCRIFITEAPNALPIGQVRLERRGGTWEIGYSIAAPFRGQGLAAAALRSAMDALSLDEGACMVARVKPGNEASARVFRRLDFQESYARDQRVEFLLFTRQHPASDNQGQS